jgi:ADP-heptose:LPS heptosyltransferase
MAWGDIAARLLDGEDAPKYECADWPAPPFSPYARPGGPYCVLHLGASSPHKLWPPERWQAVRDWAEARGYQVVLSAGKGEEGLLAAVDAEGTRSQLAGRLDLPQLWDLLRNAAFLVCPDTGIAHLARLVGVPTVALYGPGSPISTGPGAFWSASPFTAMWDPDVPCRDQDRLFERRLTWLRQCWRSVAECGNPVCIRRVAVDPVISAIEELLR